MQSKAHEWIRYETKWNVVIEMMGKSICKTYENFIERVDTKLNSKEQQTKQKQKNKSKLFAIFLFRRLWWCRDFAVISDDFSGRERSEPENTRTQNGREAVKNSSKIADTCWRVGSKVCST